MKQGIRITILTMGILVAGFILGRLAHAEPIQSQEVQTVKVFELRTYTTPEGKLPNLLTRFRDHTMRIFEKHGMTNVGYWIPEDRENTLIYVISHESRPAADQNWQDFRDDLEWQQVAEESQRDGPIVTNVERAFMSATDFSPLQ